MLNPKRKPTDSTIRNVQAANKRLAKLEKELKRLKLIQAVQGVEIERQNKFFLTKLIGKLK